MLCLGVQQSCVIQHIQRIQTFTCYKQSVLKHPPGQSVIITGVRTILLYSRRTQKTHCTSFQLNPIRLPTMYPYNVPRPPLAVICHFEIDNCIISTYYYTLRRICTESNFPGINRINPNSSV